MILIVLVILSRVDSQNMVVGNSLPCGEDNLSCINQIDPCLVTAQLCDGTDDCENGLDEGNNFASLDCKLTNAVACSCLVNRDISLH